MNYFDNVLAVIGHTPLVRLHKVTRGLRATVLAKLEFLNPGGSIKDRIGLAMIEAAEREGKLNPGGTIVEGTSGNTGVGLAIAAAIKGYRCIFVMPDKMSDEKVRLLRAYGARVVITPTAVEPDDPRSYYSVSKRLVQETPNSILAGQYWNAANPEAHYRTTGPEIWEQTAGQFRRQMGSAISGREDDMDNQIDEAVRHTLTPLKGLGFTYARAHGLRRGLTSLALRALLY